MHSHPQRHQRVAVDGGRVPIVVRSLINTDTADVETADSEMVRVTVDRDEAAAAVPKIRNRVAQLGATVPVVDDFHYIGHTLLAHYPACAGALDKFRVNPRNVRFKNRAR